MKLLGLLIAISIGTVTVADAANVRHSHYRHSADKQQIALKLFSKDESKKDESKKENPKKEDSKKSKSRKGGDEQSAEQPTEEKEKPAPIAVTPKPIPVATPSPSDTAPTDSMQIDTAMMSVLRDIDKSLRENEDVSKISDPAQHAAVAAALNALDIALDKAAANPNRIVETQNKDKYDKSLTAESWESGDVQLPNGSHASLNVLWAKKVNGLVNISITGNCGCHPNYAGERVGEWVVVLNGKSTLDSGFDIQSQANVNFWLGKLSNFNVDATTCTDQISHAGTSPKLKALNTEQRRKFFAEASPAAKKSIKEDVAAKPSSDTSHKSKPAEILDQAHLPSMSAHVLVPKRAIAGEYLTVCVVDADGKPEPFVEINFNDFKATTNSAGRVTFQVPEDSAPGPSLSVSLAGRSEAGPEQVYILQPLIRASATDIPRIDHWNVNRAENTITIEGHNFDGVAENNRVILDARKEATIRFSSPVEIQAHVQDLPTGGHDVIVQRNGLRSEPISLGIPADPAEAIVSKTKKKS
jgi:hypothetical protein